MQAHLLLVSLFVFQGLELAQQQYEELNFARDRLYLLSLLGGGGGAGLLLKLPIKANLVLPLTAPTRLHGILFIQYSVLWYIYFILWLYLFLLLFYSP